MSTQIQEPLFTETQQQDMRGLLTELHAYFMEAHPLLFKGSSVLVSPDFAMITVPVGKIPEGNNEAVSAYSEKRASITKRFEDFHREHYTTGSPLLQWKVSTPESVEAHYKLIPNDIIGAETLLRKLLLRLRARL